MRAAPALIALICAAAVVSVYGGTLKSISGRSGVCSFSVTGGMGEPQPLLLNPGTATFKRSADVKGTISFDANEAVLLACPGSGNYLTVSVMNYKEDKINCLTILFVFPGSWKWSSRGNGHLFRGNLLCRQWSEVRLQHPGVQELSRTRSENRGILPLRKDFDPSRFYCFYWICPGLRSLPRYYPPSHALHQVHPDQGCCWITNWNRSS